MARDTLTDVIFFGTMKVYKGAGGGMVFSAVRRCANAVVIGPVLQGLNKPVDDSSHG